MSVAPSAHDAKFDRQLRLWGAAGQQRLESSSLLVFGSTASASESLKNLVLPNLASATIVDDHIVTQSDVGSNWFVNPDDVGKSRAESIASSLCEMNSQFKCSTLTQSSPDSFIMSQPDAELSKFIARFECILVACQLSEKNLLRIAHLSDVNSIPFLHIRSIGLIGSVRLQLPRSSPHCIIESHPTNDRSCVYITPNQLSNWPELASFCAEFADSSKFDSEQHAHIPWLVLLVNLSAEWRQSHSGKLPSTYDEKQAFKHFIMSKSTDSTELNFEEAQSNAHRLYDQPLLDSQTQSVVDDVATQDQVIKELASTIKSTPSDQVDSLIAILMRPYGHHRFFLLVAALRQFIANSSTSSSSNSSSSIGCMLPCSSDLPDMHSLTEWYVSLKTLFIQRAERDAQKMTSIVQQLLTKKCAFTSRQIQIHSPTHSEIMHFCKHVRELRVVRTSSISDEYDQKTFPTSELNEALDDDGVEPNDDNSSSSSSSSHLPPRIHPLFYYFAFRSIDSFHSSSLRFPGDISAHIEIDRLHLQTIHSKLIQSSGIDSRFISSSDSRLAHELTRYGGREVHTISAFIGGVAAQVILKILIHQFVPMNNTLIYDGITCTSKVLKL